jgi:hypothetical protein
MIIIIIHAPVNYVFDEIYAAEYLIYQQSHTYIQTICFRVYVFWICNNIYPPLNQYIGVENPPCVDNCPKIPPQIFHIYVSVPRVHVFLCLPSGYLT